MKRLMLLIGFCICSLLRAQSEEEAAAILGLLGIMSVEDASEDQIQHFMHLLRHPVDINSEGRSGLESSGLFTPYQLVSLSDYMSRHGKVFSFGELASVDGFTWRHVEFLRPFLTFGYDAGMDAGTSSMYFRGEADLKSALKIGEEDSYEWNYGVRMRCSVGAVIEAALSAFRPYDSPSESPSLYSAGASWTHKYGKVVLGDFNARFGQGLCLWNTVMFSSLASPSSFMKKPAGISLSHSHTGTYAMTGLAADLTFGKWKFSAMAALPEIKRRPGVFSVIQPAVNVARYLRFGHVSLTHTMGISEIFSRDYRIPDMKTSADASFCFRGVNLFSEVLYDWVDASVSFVAGTEASVGEALAVASLVRYLPLSHEHGAAFSGEFRKGRHETLFSIDLKHDTRGERYEGYRIQVKPQCKWTWRMTDFLCMVLRMTGRLRTWSVPVKADLRADVRYDSGPWMACLRLNVSRGNGTGLLGYAEAGCKALKNMKLYVRQGFFRIDDWEDRIYAYERDAPDSFNVPAFYGRGLWTSLYAAAGFAEWGSLYLRASYVGYPFMREKKKSGKAELKLQFALHF